MTDLLVDRREAGVDLAAANAKFGRDASEDRVAFDRTVNELRAQIQNEIKTLLGDEGYAQFKAADLEVRQTANVERLQTALTPSNAALTEQHSSAPPK
jgi:hypothetical protein